MDIPFEIPYTRILTRLGYKKSTSTMLSCQLEAVKSVIEEAAGFITLKGTYIIQDFKPAEHGIELESGDIITGTLPAKLNESASSALIMAATSGKAIMDKIEELKATNLERAVIFDATASEITDWGLEWIVKYAATMLKHQSRVVSRKRFSPGYGDFDLSNQRIFYSLLHLEQFDIHLTDSCMLVPEKSVIAMTGVR